METEGYLIYIYIRTPSVSTFDISSIPFRGLAGANYRMLVSMASGEVG